MPRLTKKVPTYRQKKDRSRKVSRGVVTLNGFEYYLDGPYGSKVSIAHYDRLIAEWLQSGRVVPPPDDEDELFEMLVEEVCLRYREYAEGYYVKMGEPTDRLNLIENVLDDITAIYGDMPAAKMTNRHVEVIRERFIQKGNCRITVNDKTRVILKVFKWARTKDLYEGKVLEVEPFPKGRFTNKVHESDGVDAVDPGVVAATLEHLPKIVADMVRVQLLTAMRSQEIRLLKPGSIKDWVYFPERHKTQHHGKIRAIPIGPEARKILKPYLMRDKNQYCFSPTETAEQTRRRRTLERKTPLSCGNKVGSVPKVKKPKRTSGDHYRRDTYAQAIKRAAKKAFPIPKKLKGKKLDEFKRQYHWSPNQLRHLAATQMFTELGGDAKSAEAVQMILGHESIKTTKIYIDKSALQSETVRAAKQAAEKIG